MNISGLGTEPNLSIVVASQNAQQTVIECLLELKNQCKLNEIEIIVVDNSSDETKEIIKEKFTEIKLIEAAKGKLIPELWGIGISHCSGKLVALTTTHFVPSKDWAQAIIKAHISNYSGIGGAIENAAHADLVSWAIYFCRYSRYMLPFKQELVSDFAADNASYKLADLERVKDSMKDGFWEVFVHQAMLNEKMLLALTPDIVVYHQKSFTFSGFINQRFWHGKQFGSQRSQNISGFKRICLILLSPLIPFLYLYRISKRVLARKKNVAKYLLSLPILFLFLVSWSIGEFSGYILNRRDG